MPNPAERGPLPLSAIHVNFQDRSIVFIADDYSATKLTLAPEGVLYQAFPAAPSLEPSPSDPAAEPPLATGPTIAPDEPAPAEPPGAEGKEKQPLLTLTGRLKTQPREGRPDSRGNPTAWARLAVYEEGRDDAHLYSVTFHKHTARLAQGLPRDAQVTVQGYAHHNEDPGSKRLDTFSVVNLLNYPGKAARQEPG